jgi:hypothetical protein
MHSVRLAPLALVFSSLTHAQSITRADLPSLLNFEGQQAGAALRGWGGGPAGTIFPDDQIVHTGKWSARIERNAASQNSFSTITIGIPVDFAGNSISLRGYLKTEGVSEFAGLWMREDDEGGANLAFDNMQSRRVGGTTNWTQYSITLPLRPEAKRLFFGVLSAGMGKTWADDLALVVDGKPVWEAPDAVKPKTIIDIDTEFEHDSRITLSTLSPVQIENLATLGKVWGFLKYHHPAITAGTRHWDYDLIRFLPQILMASSRAAANSAMHQWIGKLGEVKNCAKCANLNTTEIYMKPDIGWISDTSLLGAELSQDLQRIYKNRSTSGKQFYLSLVPNVQNPVFEHELGYAGVRLPDAGFQLLALYRFWNMIEYWYPYRDVMGEDWNAVLPDSIPKIALAKTAVDYQLQLMALIARVHDTHANLWTSLPLRPPGGKCEVPVKVRFVENVPVIAGFFHPEDAPPELKTGDVILDINGVSAKALVERWTPYYAASNDPTRLRDIGGSFTRGDCGPINLRLRREEQTLDVTVSRKPPNRGPGGVDHDLPGPTFRRLSKDVAYLKLSSVKIADVSRYLDSAWGTKGLIIDIRNYPSEFVVFDLGSHLVDRQTNFVRFTAGDLSNPGAFFWTPPMPISPLLPIYSGKLVILLDEISQSQSEYTAMAFRAARGATVIGSTTAGADGNVSPIQLPGGFRSMISGIGIFYPDKKPTQRVGIIPDIEVKPTIAGIREGRDEVLEAAVRQILGPDTPAQEIRSIARP